MSNDVRVAMREAICKALMEGEFTPATCSTVMRLTEAARDFIRATASKPEDFANGTHQVGDTESGNWIPPNSLFGSMNSETFGAKMIREMLPMIQGMNQNKNDTPEKLVEGIAAAEVAGLSDVADALRKRLGVPAARFEPGLLNPIDLNHTAQPESA